MNNIIECFDVKKEFGKTKVLKGVNLSIEEKKIYALLGRNGSGKTTLLNLLTTKYINYQGEIKIYGEDPYENENILKKICFMSDTLPGFQNSAPKEIFDYAKMFYDNWDQKLANKLISFFHLDVLKNYNKLSKGQKTAVSIVIGLASRAPITLLDEIYVGLDAVARQEFYKILLDDFMENPRTFIISTHLIDEMSNLFSNVLLLHNGKILIDDDVIEVRNKAFEFIIDEYNEDLLNGKNIIKTSTFGHSKRIFIYDNIDLNELNNMKMKGIKIRSLSLQELFVGLTENWGDLDGETV